MTEIIIGLLCGVIGIGVFHSAKRLADAASLIARKDNRAFWLSPTTTKRLIMGWKMVGILWILSGLILSLGKLWV